MGHTQRRRRHQGGFSLIELMVVVAIMGILVTMATPKLMAYRARSARAEVMANLGAVRSVLETHMSEKGFFTDNLSKLGFAPSGHPRYIYGFTSDAQPSASGRNDTAEIAASGFTTDQMINAAGFPLSEGDLPTSIVTKTTFRIGAAGNIDQDPTLDQWYLDRDEGFKNVLSDVN